MNIGFNHFGSHILIAQTDLIRFSDPTAIGQHFPGFFNATLKIDPWEFPSMNNGWEKRLKEWKHWFYSLVSEREAYVSRTEANRLLGEYLREKKNTKGK
jgi:hypothetical protein